jgi:hypothetical protein
MATRRAVYFLVLCSFSGLAASVPFHKLSDWLVRLENVIRTRQQHERLKPQKCHEQLDLYKQDINLDTLKLVSGLLSSQQGVTLGHMLKIVVEGYWQAKNVSTNYNFFLNHYPMLSNLLTFPSNVAKASENSMK